MIRKLLEGLSSTAGRRLPTCTLFDAYVNPCSLRPYSTGRAPTSSRPRLVILGSGWGAASLAKNINTSKYAVTCLSTRNHMVFTPLLPGAAVGTVECRSTALSMMAIQPEFKRLPHRFVLGQALDVDPTARLISCKDEAGGEFQLPFDKLVIATGSQGSTFGTPGVNENALFLRDVSNAMAIRNKILTTYALAFSPGQSEKEKQRLLQTVIVGGGPTGVEFAGELCDFIHSELRAYDGYRSGQAKVTIVEAQGLLGTFDESLRAYALSKLHKQGVEIIEKGMVKEITPKEAILQDGRVIPFGMCVWSTGVGPTPFTNSLAFAKTARGRLAVDKYLRILQNDEQQGSVAKGDKTKGVAGTEDEHAKKDAERSEQLSNVEGIYALGDCCANIGTPLPALAQVAEQQGKYLAGVLNSEGTAIAAHKPFVWKQRGSMATLGSKSAIIELGEHGKHVNMKGITSYIAWKSAYFSMLFTNRNRLQILGNWIATAIWGRDVSKW